MDMQRAMLAVVLSFLVIIGYQQLFVNPYLEEQAEQQKVEQAEAEQAASPSEAEKKEAVVQEPEVSAPAIAAPQTPASVAMASQARDITIDTPLYSAVINEHGGGFKSFFLKSYQEEISEGSDHVQLVKTKEPMELPLLFTINHGVSVAPVYRADQENIVLGNNKENAVLTMSAELDSEIRIDRVLVFKPDSYEIEQTYRVTNSSGSIYQFSPALTLTNKPFSKSDFAGRFMFNGSVAYIGDELMEVKGKKLEEGAWSRDGKVGWAAYEDNYFICAAIPLNANRGSVTMSADGEKVRTVLSGETVSLSAGESGEFRYKSYFGPKKLNILQGVGYNLSRAVNFGWFDMLAKPMLGLLNFFHKYLHNYGIAIILLTMLIKGAFWPIAQKGMMSMKNMQKLQPKVVKLKERFKDDPQKMQQEMMALYRSYKVNPLGGCLPMFLQIPFFFALYKVLLMSIELRHAPFMLWINDLSAPDRLWIGFDLPFLHGIPVLTILMGISMYFQQKMTPTTADPTQAKVMQMIPVIFTFMFINFSSGLVLYWFVNNLLSMLQQYLINRRFNKA